MVHAKARHVLANVYGGRLSLDGTNYGYSDIAMDAMSRQQPGKPSLGNQNDVFEVVSESDLDFTNFKNRADFASEHGGDGELYGRPIDLVSERSQTPKSFMVSDDDLTRSGTPPPMPALRQQRLDQVQYHPAFRRTTSAESDVAGPYNGSLYNLNSDSESNLLRGAQYPAGYNPVRTQIVNDSHEALGLERWRTGGSAYTGVDGSGNSGYEAYRPGLRHQDSFKGV